MYADKGYLSSNSERACDVGISQAEYESRYDMAGREDGEETRF